MVTVAWFGNMDAITPDLIRQLRDGIGLTALIPDDYRVHHSGFRLAEELLERSPLADWPHRPTVSHHRAVYGLAADAAPVFAGIVGPAYDDTRLLRVMEEAARQGIEVWAHVGLWGYGGDIRPELGLVDDQGQPIAKEDEQWGVPMCPNDTVMRNWVAETLQAAVRQYGTPAIDLDHGHFPPLASFSGLFGCCCPRCAHQARAWGYDWEALLTALADLRRGVAGLGRAGFRRAAERAPDFASFLVEVSGNAALGDWFHFRVQSVTEHMRFITEAIHRVRGDDCPVDSHIFPPSIAFLSGQDLPQWETAVDRITPGWGPVVGWDECQLHSIGLWAERLCQWVPDLDEEEALHAVYRLLGYDALAMPATVAGLRAGQFNKAEVVAHEIRRAGACLSGSKPFLPPYRPIGLGPAEAEQWGDAVVGVGAAGLVTGGQLSPQVMHTMSAVVARLEGAN